MTEQQLQQLIGMLLLGCPLETAAAVAEVPLAEVDNALANDPRVAQQVEQAAARAEALHMKTIKNAANDTKNWRASVWWLERCLPEKYGKREPDTIRPERFEQLRAAVLDAIDAVRDPGDRERLRQRLRSLATRAERSKLPGLNRQADEGDKDA